MSDTPETPTSEEKPSPAYLLSLTVGNFRCFGESLEINFSDVNGKPSMWNVILGENGVGKTTILRMISYLRKNPFEPLRDFNSRNENAKIAKNELENNLNYVLNKYNLDENLQKEQIVDLIFESPIRAKNSIKKKDEMNIIVNNTISGRSVKGILLVEDLYFLTNIYPFADNAEYFVVGYGGGRISVNYNERETNIDDCINLFDESLGILSPENWLIEADYAMRLNEKDADFAKRYDSVKNILCILLPDVMSFRFRTQSDKNKRPIVEAETPYGFVNIRDLSLGYRSALAWIVDFAVRMMNQYPDSDKPFEEPAICLVDEIDLHMHPRWQKELVKKLRDIFKGTQFIVTAHSPLIVQADPDANLALLKREGDHVVIKNDVDEIKNWRVEQILASELFAGAGSEYRDLVNPPHIAVLLDRRREILGQAELTDADRAEVAEIDAKLDKLPTAERPEDQRALELIREAAALLATDDGK